MDPKLTELIRAAGQALLWLDAQQWDVSLRAIVDLGNALRAYGVDPSALRLEE